MKKRTRKNNKKVDALIVLKIKRGKYMMIADAEKIPNLIKYLEDSVPNSKCIAVFEDFTNIEIYSKKWRKLKLKELNIDI